MKYNSKMLWSTSFEVNKQSYLIVIKHSQSNELSKKTNVLKVI